MTGDEVSQNDIDPEILREFITESVANLETASGALVTLEKNPTSEEHINSAFRVFHSIKGACSFFDLISIKTVSHKVETLLSEVKNKERQVDLTTISLLLQGVDVLKSMFDRTAISSANLPLTDLEQKYLKQLDNYLNQKGPAPAEIANKLLVGLKSHQDYFLKTDKNFFNDLTSFLQSLGINNTLTETADSKLPLPVAASDASSPPSPSPTQSTAPNTQSIKKTMRVEEETIDTFLRFTGELISSSETFGFLQGKLNQSDISSQFKEEFKNAVLSFQALSQDLQKSIMDIRRLPLSSIFSKYPRMVRDLTVTLNKKVSLQTVGDEIRIDKSIIELLDDPMVHILRNSLDHGLEGPDERIKNGKPAEGSLKLSVATDETSLTLKVSDDGRGIHPEKVKKSAIEKGLITKDQAATMSSSELINLIFKPGFSTAEKTTDVSGRGVGMDVVLTNIKKSNGTIVVDSVPGSGTDITIKIPLAVTTLITKGLVVTASNELLILAIDHVRSIEELSSSALFRTQGNREAVNIRNRIFPVCRLTKSLGWEKSAQKKEEPSKYLIALVEIDQVEIALIIDGLLGIQQVAMKETGQFFSTNPFLKGGGPS